MNIGRIIKSVAKKARENPELALVVIGLVAPGVARKAAPIVAAATAKRG